MNPDKHFMLQLGDTNLSARHLCDLSIIFMRIQNLATIFVILCESHNVMIVAIEFEHHKNDVPE